MGASDTALRLFPVLIRSVPIWITSGSLTTRQRPATSTFPVLYSRPNGRASVKRLRYERTAKDNCLYRHECRRLACKAGRLVRCGLDLTGSGLSIITLSLQFADYLGSVAGDRPSHISRIPTTRSQFRPFGTLLWRTNTRSVSTAGCHKRSL